MSGEGVGPQGRVTQRNNMYNTMVYMMLVVVPSFDTTILNLILIGKS